MQRGSLFLVFAAAASLLAGCAYDPYTGLWVPCCDSYGYAYPYHHPGPYSSPYGYPYGTPPAAPQGAYPESALTPGAAAAPVRGRPLAQRFAAANVTHDGRLTREQAAWGMPLVAREFDAIDIDRKGYVTLPEIQAFVAQRRAEGAQSRPPGGE